MERKIGTIPSANIHTPTFLTRQNIVPIIEPFVFLSLMIDFVLAKSVEVLGEMLHYAAFNLGLHRLPK